MQIIRKNFGLKALSFALALLGWAYFRFAANPVLAARFDQQMSVPITAVNLPVGYVAHFTDKEAVVTIATHRGASPVKPDDVKAVLDLANKGAGAYNVPVQLVAPDIIVQSLSPASVSLSVERIDQKSYPLAIHYTRNDGSNIVVATAQTEPNSVTVRGTSGELSSITSVRVDVALPVVPQRTDAMVRPIVVDNLGNELTDVAIAPDLVRVRVTFVSGTGAPKKP